MDDPAAVGIGDRVADCQRSAQELPQCDMPTGVAAVPRPVLFVQAIDGRRQGLSLDQPTHEVRHARDPPRRGIHRHDARMLQHARDVRLELEPLAVPRVVCKRGLELLQGHLAAELLVERHEDIARPPAVEQAEDAEPAAGPCQARRLRVVSVEVDVLRWCDNRRLPHPGEHRANRLDAVREPSLILVLRRDLAGEPTPFQLQGEQLPEQFVPAALCDYREIRLNPGRRPRTQLALEPLTGVFDRTGVGRAGGIRMFVVGHEPGPVVCLPTRRRTDRPQRGGRVLGSGHPANRLASAASRPRHPWPLWNRRTGARRPVHPAAAVSPAIVSGSPQSSSACSRT